MDRVTHIAILALCLSEYIKVFLCSFEPLHFYTIDVTFLAQFFYKDMGMSDVNLGAWYCGKQNFSYVVAIKL